MKEIILSVDGKTIHLLEWRGSSRPIKRESNCEWSVSSTIQIWYDYERSKFIVDFHFYSNRSGYFLVLGRVFKLFRDDLIGSCQYAEEVKKNVDWFLSNFDRYYERYKKLQVMK